jgi:hypothetical protein
MSLKLLLKSVVFIYIYFLPKAVQFCETYYRIHTTEKANPKVC